MKVGRSRGTTVLTIEDIVMMGVDKAAEIALDVAWSNARENCVPQLRRRFARRRICSSTGWPEPAASSRAKSCASCASSRAKVCAAWKSSKSPHNMTSATNRAHRHTRHHGRARHAS